MSVQILISYRPGKVWVFLQCTVTLTKGGKFYENIGVVFIMYSCSNFARSLIKEI